MATRLSPKQTTALEYVAEATKPVSGPSLADRLGTSVQGAHQTMASLVRRGLVARVRRHGFVHYVTPEAAR